MIPQASQLNDFEPDKAYEYENLSDGRPNKKLRRRTEYVIAASSASDITELPYGEAVLVTSQVTFIFSTLQGSQDIEPTL